MKGTSGKRRCRICFNSRARERWNTSNTPAMVKRRRIRRGRLANHVDKWKERFNIYTPQDQLVITDDYMLGMTEWLKYKYLATCNRNEKRKSLEHNISFEYILDICKKQEYKCAITKFLMPFSIKNPYSASIDRIDSANGYIIGNIQIVCTFINLAKNNLSNNFACEFVEALRNQGRNNIMM